MKSLVSRHALPSLENVDWPAIDPSVLDAVRTKVKQHVEATGSVDELDIDGNAPPRGMPFAFVSPIPTLPKHQRRDRDFWHRCSYCETDRKFIDGRIVFCSDGRMRLIGDDCWQIHISERDWSDARDEFQDYRNRDRFELLMVEYPPVLNQLCTSARTELKREPLFVFAETLGETFRNAMPELAEALKNSLGRGGHLEVSRMVPDYSALEGSRGQRTSQDDSDTPIRYKEVAVIVHTLPNQIIFTNEPMELVKLVAKAVRLLMSATNFLRKTEWLKLENRTFSRKANKFEKKCQDAVTSLTKALEIVGAISQFMDGRNMAGIAKWANDHDCELCITGQYTPIPRGLLFEPERDDDTRVLLPSDFRLQFAGIDDLKHLLTRHQIGR